MNDGKDKLEMLLIAEKGLVKILEKIRIRIDLLRAVDRERKRKHDADRNTQMAKDQRCRPNRDDDLGEAGFLRQADQDGADGR